MGQINDLFGYIQIGASPSEMDLLKQALQYNRKVLENYPTDSIFCPEDFRFSNSEDIGLLRMISVTKTHRLRDMELVTSEIKDLLTRLIWSSGMLVDFSYDRPLVGDPALYQYTFFNHGHNIKNLRPPEGNFDFEVESR